MNPLRNLRQKKLELEQDKKVMITYRQIIKIYREVSPILYSWFNSLRNNLKQRRKRE